MIDTLVSDQLSADLTRERLWRLLDSAYEHRAWVTLFSREQHANVRADIERWVASRRDAYGHVLSIEHNSIVEGKTRTPILNVWRGTERMPFLSVHFPTVSILSTGVKS